ncbi:hypothetical protein K6Y31_08430 [Motilimonas cestriensis]|uniref:Uncharacterized protein n=1 Tax=Motilimonas cestriensis TaxID=2742685 RepID=A0ABS8W785_9GAMM|nr:hypothetical protein [Motilimonas cestriensis]MCE2594839.1 hypothetical protein [Motilimonas cestriensis]
MRKLFIAATLCCASAAYAENETRLLLQYKADDTTLKQDVTSMIEQFGCPISATKARSDNQAIITLACELPATTKTQLLERLTQSQMLIYAEFDQIMTHQSTASEVK